MTLLNDRGHVRTAPPQSSLDYNALLSAGIGQCQALGSDHWTDYNEHDPGVTTLEQLCYALTDLAYRAGFSVPDLLAEDADGGKPGYTSLYTGDRALSSAPLTRYDYRKMAHSMARSAGLANFKNLWLEPVTVQGVGGLYDMQVEVYDDSGDQSALLAACREVFFVHRNLCEDLRHAAVLEPCGITVDARIELDAGVPPEQAMAGILYALQDMLVPFVPIESVGRRLAGGQSPDEVFLGPLLECGHIADEYLRPRRLRVDGSDATAAILAVPGVRSLDGLSLGTDKGTPDATGISIGAQQVPRLAPSIFAARVDWGGLVLTRRGQPLPVDGDAVHRLLQQMLGALHASASAAANVAIAYSRLPVGRPRNVARYVSVQRHFPHTYGIGPGGVAAGLAQDEDQLQQQAVRRAQARQLKAWLLHFEQMLADCGAQLANAGRLLSLDPDLAQTYFCQSLPDLPEGPPDMIELLRSPAAPAPLPRPGDRHTAHVDIPGGLGLRSRAYDDAGGAAAAAAAMLERGGDEDAYVLRPLPADPRAGELWILKARDGGALAVGTRLYAGADQADSDKQAMIAHLRLLAADAGARSRDLRIVSHGSCGAQLVADEGEVLLAADGMTAAEQSEWTARLLREGCNPANYRAAPQADGGRQVQLLRQGAVLAEGARRYPDGHAAAAAIAAMVALVQTLCCNDAAQRLHLRFQPPLAPPAPSRPGKAAYEAGIRALAAADDPWRARRNRFLDHLLARFDETFRDDALRQADPRSVSDPEAFDQDLIDNKLQFLAYFIDRCPEHDTRDQRMAYGLSGGRMRGIGRGPARTGPMHGSGLAARLELLLATPRDPATGQPSDRLYVVEHLLLLPAPPPDGIDAGFYAHRLSVVLPASKPRFQSPAMRALAEQLVAENCPAHLQADCLWLEAPALDEFERLYRDWRAARGMADSGQADSGQASAMLAAFIGRNDPAGAAA